MKTFHCQCVCLCVTLLSIGFSASALAEDYFLNKDQPSGNSWTTAAYWTPNGAASAGNNYYVGGGFLLRTPTTTSSTFPGAALYLGYGDGKSITTKDTLNGGVLGIKSNGATNSTVTINNLIVGGTNDSPARIRNAIEKVTTATLKGNITINGYAEFVAFGEALTDQRKLVINSTIKGTGNISIYTAIFTGSTLTDPHWVKITSAVAPTPYSGAVTVPTGSYLILSGTALQSANSITVGGKLGLEAGNAISSSSSVVNNGVINYGTTAQQLNALTGTGSINGTGALTLANATNSTYSGTITGTGASVTKTGTGTLSLSGKNTYTGATTISEGTLELSGSGVINVASEIDISQNGTLKLASTAYPQGSSFANPITGSGKILQVTNKAAMKSDISGFTGTFQIQNETYFTGNIDGSKSNWTVSNGALLKNVSGNTIQIKNITTDSGTYLARNAVDGNTSIYEIGSGDINGVIGYTMVENLMSGVELKKVSDGTAFGGTLTVSNTNTYTGGTTVSAGTLAITNSGALGTGAITLNGGMLSTTASETIVLDESVAINANSTIDTTNGLTLSGSISGTAALTKTGTGTLTLSGANDYSGGTTVSAGTLALSGATNLNNSASITNDAAITADSAQTFNNLSGTEGTASINIGTNALTLNNTENSSYAGIITGASSVTKTGTGTLTLSGANDYSGGTTVSAGTLNLDIANAIAPSASVTNNAAITSTSAQEFNNLAGTVNTASIDLGTNALTLNNTVESIYTGNLTAGTINVTGSDATTLKLNGTINGNVTVSSGKLDIKGALFGGLEVSAGSIFSPGNSIGHTEQTGGFTLKAGAEILYELSADDYDWLHVIGTATFENDSIIALGYTGALPSSAKSYELLTSTELILNEADFNWNQILIDAGLNTTNWSWNIANNNIVLNYTPTEIPVPEPSTWALLILGALGMMYFRRKK